MYGEVKATVSVQIAVSISMMRLEGTFEECQRRALDAASNQIRRCLGSGGPAYPMVMVGARVEKLDASINSVPELPEASTSRENDPNWPTEAK